MNDNLVKIGDSWPKPIPLTGTETVTVTSSRGLNLCWPKPIPLTGTETFLERFYYEENICSSWPKPIPLTGTETLH